MRNLFFVALLAGVIPLPLMAAPATTPGFKPFDQQQFAKLQAQVGTWTCNDTPPSKKPDVIITKQQGNYYVSRETGDNPNTSYSRWSATGKRYYSITIFDSGASNVFETTALDPNNATWIPAWPPARTRQDGPYNISLSGNTMTGTGQYLDANGKIQTGKTVCTKQ